MNHRDRVFLRDMSNFIYMNRVATAFSLAETITNPQPVTAKTVRGIHGQPHEMLAAIDQEALINELSQARMGSIQSIMIARIYAELIAAYEDLGAFAWAIKKRKTEGKGIFLKYLETRDGGYTQFYQYIINKIDGSNPNDPPVTSGDIFKLPPISDLQGHVPQQLLGKFEQEYVERPKHFYNIAKFYMGNVGDVWKLATTTPPERPVERQEANTEEAESYVHIILGAIAVGEQPPQGKITKEVYNKIKHVFMATENLSAYEDQTDPVQILYTSFKRHPHLVQDWLDGIKSAAGCMNDLASILLLLDHFGVPL